MPVRTRVVFAAIFSVPLLSGCASTSDGQEAAAPQPREYRTGSNLPARDIDRGSVKTLGSGTVEQMRSPATTGVRTGP
jgi:hypothetical protein